MSDFEQSAFERFDAAIQAGALELAKSISQEPAYAEQLIAESREDIKGLNPSTSDLLLLIAADKHVRAAAAKLTKARIDQLRDNTQTLLTRIEKLEQRLSAQSKELAALRRQLD